MVYNICIIYIVLFIYTISLRSQDYNTGASTNNVILHELGNQDFNQYLQVLLKIVGPSLFLNNVHLIFFFFKHKLLYRIGCIPYRVYRVLMMQNIFATSCIFFVPMVIFCDLLVIHHPEFILKSVTEFITFHAQFEWE